MTGALHAGDAASSRRDALAFLPIRALRAALRERPPAEALALGATWGRRVAALGGTLTDVSRINLGIAFPEASVLARERMLADAYANLGRGVAELALLQGPHRDALLAGVRVEGEDHLADAIAGSRTGGVLVVSAHFGTWDLYAAAVARRGHPISVVQRGFRSDRLSHMMSRIRLEGGGDLEEIEMGPGAGGALMSALRRGRRCIVLLDQNARPSEGVFVPFFSRPACTRFAPAVIAMRLGVPVLPVFGHRVDEGAHHVVRIGPALPVEPGRGDRRDPAQAERLRANVAAMTGAIEAAIRARPDQWLWSQRRWQTRPGSDADPSQRLYPARTGWLRVARRGLRRALA